MQMKFDMSLSYTHRRQIGVRLVKGEDVFNSHSPLAVTPCRVDLTLLIDGMVYLHVESLDICIHIHVAAFSGVEYACDTLWVLLKQLNSFLIDFGN